MKPIVLALAGLPIALLMLAAILFGSAQPRPPNPFTAYESWMPTHELPISADCERYDWYLPYSVDYVYCDLGANAPFKAIRMYGRDGQITTTFFYPVEARLGELVSWLGPYQRIVRGKVAWYVTWPEAQATTRRSVNRYQAQVMVVWFHEKAKGDKR